MGRDVIPYFICDCHYFFATSPLTPPPLLCHPPFATLTLFLRPYLCDPHPILATRTLRPPQGARPSAELRMLTGESGELDNCNAFFRHEMDAVHFVEGPTVTTDKHTHRSVKRWWTSFFSSCASSRVTSSSRNCSGLATFSTMAKPRLSNSLEDIARYRIRS